MCQTDLYARLWPSIRGRQKKRDIAAGTVGLAVCTLARIIDVFTILPKLAMIALTGQPIRRPADPLTRPRRRAPTHRGAPAGRSGG